MPAPHRLALPLLLTVLAASRCTCTGGDALGDVPGTIQVITCDTRGDPVAGVEARTTEEDGTDVASQSNSEGRADLLVRPGSYQVRLTGGGPERTLEPVTVGGEDTVVVMDELCIGPRQLPGRGAVAGDICNRHVGTWVKNAQVTLIAFDGERREVRTDDSGHFLLHNVAAGEANLRVRGAGPYVKRFKVQVAPKRVNWITEATECRPLGLGDECTDLDDDGYGEGKDCIDADCDDADDAIFEGCLEPLPPAGEGSEAPPEVFLPRIEVTPSQIEFTGLLAGADPRSAQITVRNLGTGPLLLGEPHLSGGENDNRFLLSGLVHDLAPGEELVITITVLPPNEPRDMQAVLVIPSNDDVRPEVAVPLRANIGLAPGLVLTPEVCDRQVGVGRPAVCEYSVVNTADHVIDIAALGMAASSDPGFSIEPVTLPQPVPVGTAFTLRVIMSPPLAQPYEGQLQVVSSEGQILHATARVTGAGDPTAVIDVESVGGVPVPAGTVPPMRPLDNVVLTSVRSAAPPGRTLASRTWRLISRPPESTVVLLTPNNQQTRFAFNSSGVTRNGMDVAGTYVVGLVVRDSSGQESAEATMTLQAIPGQGIHLQLTWEHPSSDMDLHLIRGSGTFGSLTNDCHYGNCRPDSQGNPRLDWGTLEQSPVLDVDDVNGYGPENINLEDPAANTYKVGVHYFATHGGSSAVPCTVKIFVGSSLAGEFTRTLTTEDVFWEVAEITIPTGAVTELDTLEYP
ncbi:MAG: hypothetical protein AB2A00_31580 [Myxococcota bacterium]